MQNFLKFIERALTASSLNTRYRDSGPEVMHYSSQVFKCIRDQYWKIKGEPATNPIDFTGALRMEIGNWVETGLNKFLQEQLSYYGFHFRPDSNQAPVGGGGAGTPKWTDRLDGLYDIRLPQGDKFVETVLGEVKLKYGNGADFFLKDYNVGESYLATHGEYLRHLHQQQKQGVPGLNLYKNRGIFFFVIFSDSNFAQMVQICTQYLPEEDIVQEYHVYSTLGEDKPLDICMKLDVIEVRRRKLEEYVAKDVTPPGEYVYKKPLTPEFLENVSDAQLRKAIAGEKILGDWQPAYSEYFEKQLQTDKVSREYTEYELAQLKAEYKRRHPKSKIA